MSKLSVEECFHSDNEESWEVWVDDFLALPTENVQEDVQAVPAMPAPLTTTWPVLEKRGAHQEDEQAVPAMPAPLTSTWPVLEKRGAHKEDVQSMVFAIWCAYRAFRAHTALNKLGDRFRFGDMCIPIFDRPPGYKGIKSQMLKYEIVQSYTNTLDMQRAVCVVDHASKHTEPRHYGDRVSFAGPRARTLHDTAFNNDGEKLFVARMGGDNVPADSVVKAWRYDVVETKEDPTGEWYICVFLPYRKEARSRKRKSP